MYQLILERKAREGPPRLEEVELKNWLGDELPQCIVLYGNSLKIGAEDSIRMFNSSDDALRLSFHHLVLMRDTRMLWELSFYAYREHVDEMVEKLCLKNSPSL